MTPGEGLKRGEILLVSDDVIGKKRKLITGCGSLHCIALFDPHTGALLETYLSKGSTGGCNNFMVGLSRMISISARGGISIETIVDQLNSSRFLPFLYSQKSHQRGYQQGLLLSYGSGKRFNGYVPGDAGGTEREKSGAGEGKFLRKRSKKVMEKKDDSVLPYTEEGTFESSGGGRISGRDPLYPSKSPQQPYGAGRSIFRI